MIPAAGERILRTEVADILREAIWRGQLRPGERLNELVLAEQIGVSRPPLREAIRTLEGEGLVVSKPRRGAFVKTLSSDDVLEIYSLRCALETIAAERVIDVGDPNIPYELEQRLDLVEAESAAVPDLYAVISTDLEFHRTLVRAANNSRLLEMWERLVGELRLALSLIEPEFFEMDYVERTHRPLLEAIRDGDRARAREMVDGLLDVGRALQERWAALDRLPDGG
jgi:DNA-binding GntR family transcriptional regulator